MCNLKQVTILEYKVGRKSMDNKVAKCVHNAKCALNTQENQGSSDSLGPLGN